MNAAEAEKCVRGFFETIVDPGDEIKVTLVEDARGYVFTAEVPEKGKLFLKCAGLLPPNLRDQELLLALADTVERSLEEAERGTFPAKVAYYKPAADVAREP